MIEWKFLKAKVVAKAEKGFALQLLISVRNSELNEEKLKKAIKASFRIDNFEIIKTYRSSFTFMITLWVPWEKVIDFDFGD